MRTMWAGVVTLAVVGCAVPNSDDPLVVVVSPADTDLMRATDTAASEWNACGGRRVMVRPSPSDGVRVSVVDGIVRPDGTEAGGVTLRGPSDGMAVEVHVVRYSDDAQRAIVAHELGHVLGLDDLPSGLMSGTRLRADAHVGANECAALLAISD